MVGPWLCSVVEVIVLWTVAMQGYGNLLDASVDFHLHSFRGERGVSDVPVGDRAV